ncbi:MAG: GlpG protein [Pirellulaceae bacterium]|jgi:GlpG protein
MRYIGEIENQSEATRIVAYLVATGIDAQAEENNNNGWTVWVRHEDHFDRALTEFKQYAQDPRNSKYDGHEKVAEQIRREENERRARGQKNVVEMRGKWGSGAPRGKTPVTLALIAISVIVAFMTGFGEDPDSWLIPKLLFHGEGNFEHVNRGTALEKLGSIMELELWRLVSPIFLHFGPMHIVMNMWVLFVLGGQFERRKGPWKYLAFVLATGIVANCFQSLVPYGLGGSTFSGGMSGVMYAVFGYIWMKAWYDREDRFQISEMNIIMLVGWFFLCMTGWMGNIGNWAHGSGMVMGMLIALVPVYLRDGKIG